MNTREEVMKDMTRMFQGAVKEAYEDLLAKAVAEEREACAKVCEELGMATNGMYERNHECAQAIRARGDVHAIDISQERVDEMAKNRHEWVGFTEEEAWEMLRQMSLGASVEDVRFIEAKLKEKNT